MFKLGFVGGSVHALDQDYPRGYIIAGELDETFNIELMYWAPNDYVRSWRRELGRLVEGAEVAVAMSVVVEPTNANWMQGYIFRRFGQEVRVQEQMFLVKEFKMDFDLMEPAKSVNPYQSHNEDGQRLSEWRMPISDVQVFLDSNELS